MLGSTPLAIKCNIIKFVPLDDMFPLAVMFCVTTNELVICPSPSNVPSHSPVTPVNWLFSPLNVRQLYHHSRLYFHQLVYFQITNWYACRTKLPPMFRKELLKFENLQLLIYTWWYAVSAFKTPLALVTVTCKAFVGVDIPIPNLLLVPSKNKGSFVPFKTLKSLLVLFLKYYIRLYVIINISIKSNSTLNTSITINM